MLNHRMSRLGTWLVPLLLAFAAAGSALADPPGRVARLSYIGGDVSMQPAGLDEWSEALINRPLITGDNLYSDRASRVEMEIGAATIRLDERTAFRLLNLDDNAAQIELTSGTLNLTVRHVFDGQTYEIDTPTLALVIQTPGQYRVDIAPQGDSTMVSVVDGNGDVYGRDNASFRVRQGESYRFHDSQLKDYEVFDLPQQDEFDQWCYERTERYDNSPSREYVSDETIGYADLDGYGSWSSAPSYGSIWYPSHIDAGWTPYRDGHWAWIDPWGWTWVDNAPWGFAPSHYGRWAQVNSRWGWVPGPRHVRPIYAPALVAFVGGGGFSVGISSGGPIGWFPLGPRDVYVPWYHGSRNYFNNVNVRNTTIINNTYITNVYNNYSRGQPVNNFNYAYQNDKNAYTAVSRDAFINARSVNSARVQVAQAQLAQGRVVSRIDVAPTARSFAGSNVAAGSRRTIAPGTFERGVIARTAPPAQRLGAQERIKAISRNNNQPLAIDQMRELSTTKPASGAGERQMRRVQVVGGERPAATAVPSRAGAIANGRVQRAAPAGNPAGTPTDTRVERTTQPVQPGRSITREGQASPTTTPRAPVERDASSRTIHAPTQRQPTPGRQPVERNAAPMKPGTTVNRDERTTAPVPTRAPVERSEATRTIRAPTQRQPVQSREPVQQREPVQRAAPVSREPQPSNERRVAPQPTPRPAPQQERRQPAPRSAPQPNVQQAAPQQRREVQPRSAPPAQQGQAAQPARPAKNPPAQKQKEKADEDSKDGHSDDQRKRRERN